MPGLAFTLAFHEFLDSTGPVQLLRLASASHSEMLVTLSLFVRDDEWPSSGASPAGAKGRKRVRAIRTLADSHALFYEQFLYGLPL